LRFDVSHPKPMKPDELAQVVFDVNAQIRANMDVRTRIMTPKEAVDAGAMALFGEKYGDEVRVVAMGEYSTELCGGTHVRRTGDIGGFRIISETGLAAGIRRIEAVAGAAADAYDAANMNLLMQTADVFKSPPQDIPARAKQLLDDRRALEREVTDLRKKLALSGGASGAGGDADDAPDDAREVAGVRLVTRVLDGVQAKDLKSMVDAFKKQGSGVYAVISAMDGKASIVVGVTEDLVDRFNAVDLVRAGSEALGGKGGGGRPDMAQAGGSDASGADGAFDAIAALMDQ
jgi:alanyl-tRNA synthetase